MKNKLKALLHCFGECRYLKAVFKQYKKSLCKGKYRLFPGLRAIVLDEDSALNKAEMYFRAPECSGIYRLTVVFFNRIFRFRNNSESGIYEAIYTANNYDSTREVKLFSFKKNKILTICTSGQELERQISEYRKLHTTFRLPKAEKSNEYSNALEVSMVELKNRPPEREALKSIIKHSLLMYQSAAQTEDKKFCMKDSEGILIDNTEINSRLSAIVSSISEEALQTDFPVCLQHGDLSRENLIYGECDGLCDFWWIDWEHSGERIFFYDLFFYILNTTAYYDNPEALDAYYNGKYDAMLKEYFATFKLNYDSNSRNDYFLVFVWLFLRERVCDQEKIPALRMYFELLDKYKLLKK